jgi:hypothetical protein
VNDIQVEHSSDLIETEDDVDSLPEFVQAWRSRRKGTAYVADGYRLDPRPYPGLKSFAPAEANVFFGRGGQDRILAARLEQHNVLGVLGGSGSGKSSLVRAGLLPHLTSLGKIPDRTGRWYVAEMRPGTDPTTAMLQAVWAHVCVPRRLQKFGKDALEKAFAGLEFDGADTSVAEDALHEKVVELTANAPGARTDPQQDRIYLQKLIRLLVDSNRAINPQGLLRFANDTLQVMDHGVSRGLQAGPANLLVLIDQFEELFRPEIDPRGRDGIVELLKIVQKHGRRRPRPGLFLALTMRSEELHRCSEHEGLSGVILDSSVQLELISGDKDVTATIVEPARRVFESWGIDYAKTGDNVATAPFEPKLVAALKAQAGRLRESLDHKPDSLPLLQHALQSTWDNALARWRRRLQAGDNVEPTIKMTDFAARYEDSPLRRCLNAGAEDARQEALKVLLRIGRSYELSRQDASNLIDVAFVSLARLDDSNRWVRQFASVEEIAEASGLFKQFGHEAEGGIVNRTAAAAREIRNAFFREAATERQPELQSDKHEEGLAGQVDLSGKDDDGRFHLALQAFRRARRAVAASGPRRHVVHWISHALAKSGVTDQILRRFARKNVESSAAEEKVRQELTGRKIELITAALEVFKRAGYLSFRDRNYDVSHESLIRSWDHYQRVLDRAQSVRNSLIGLEDTHFSQAKPTERPEIEQGAVPIVAVASPALSTSNLKGIWFSARGWMAAKVHRTAALTPVAMALGWLSWIGRTIVKFIKWSSFQKAKRADAALKFGKKADLERIYKSPHLFSEFWVSWQLIDYWRRRSKTRAVVGGVSSERSARPTPEEWKRAVARSRDLQALVRAADLWRVGRFRVLLLCLLAGGVGVIVYIMGEASDQLRHVIDIQTLMSDRTTPNRLKDPKYPDFDLHQAVTAAASFNRDVIDRPNWLRPGLQPAYDKLVFQLDSQAREALKSFRVHTGEAKFSGAGSERTPEVAAAQCKVIDRDKPGDELVVVTPDKHIRGVELEGIRPIYRTTIGGKSFPAGFPYPFVNEGLVCLDRTAATLLIWPASGRPFLVPVTWLPADAPIGADPNDKQSGWSAIFDFLTWPVSDTRKSQVDVPYWREENFQARVSSLQIDDVRGFGLRLKGLPGASEDWYLSYAVGINRPEPMTEAPAPLPEIYGPPEATPSCAEKDGNICTIKNLKLAGDRDFILVRKIVDPGTCSSFNPRTACAQELRLFAAKQGDDPIVRFRKLDHFSAPIIRAQADDKYLFLWDTSGQKWRYTIGWLRMLEVIRNNDLSGNLREAARTPPARHQDFVNPESRGLYLSETCRQASCYTWPRDSRLAKAGRWMDASIDNVSRGARKFFGFTTPPAAGSQESPAR